MKTETASRLRAKAALLRTLRFYQGFLLALIVVAAVAAGLKISQEPRSTLPISRDDLELFNHDNKDGTYTTYTATNAYARYGTIDWVGPTNALSLTNQEYYFAANSDCSITGIVNLPSITNTAPPSVLTVSNYATTNITLRWLVSMLTPDGSRSLVITNGETGILSVRVNQRVPQTNAIGKIFF